LLFQKNSSSVTVVSIRVQWR